MLRAKRTKCVPRQDGLKDDLIAQLDAKLKSTPSLQDNKIFAEYYDRAGSPAKKTSKPAAEEKEEKKEPKRRKTVVAKPESASST